MAWYDDAPREMELLNACTLVKLLQEALADRLTTLEDATRRESLHWKYGVELGTTAERERCALLAAEYPLNTDEAWDTAEDLAKLIADEIRVEP